MAVFVYRDGNLVDKDTGEPMVSDVDRAKVPPTPMTFGDLPGYASPIDGKWIEGRRARRYDLESNNCVDANDFGKPKKLKNERFVKKHGLQHLT